jgi:hypothetical protein
MICGAIAGAMVWIAFRGMPYVPNLFLCIVVAAWVGVGVHGLVAAEVTIAGKGGRGPKGFAGLPARLVGLAIIALSVVFIALVHTAS